jgi:hypothetical protein
MSLLRKSLPLEFDARDQAYCDPKLITEHDDLQYKEEELDEKVKTMKEKSKELKDLTQAFLQTARAAKNPDGTPMYKSRKTGKPLGGGRKRKTRKHKKVRKSHRR